MTESSRQWDQLFTYESLVHAISGSAGAITAMTVFFPLDTIRSRLQLEEHRQSKHTITMIKELIEEEGIESLYRGLHPVLGSICVSNFVFFYSFHGLRAVFSQNGKKHTALHDLLLGSLAGAINVLLTTPLWVVNMRIKMQGTKLKKGDENLRKYQQYNGLVDGLIKISRSEGYASLWSSTLPSLVLVSNPAIQIMIYEFLKRETRRFLNTENLSGSVVFLLGAVSKSISTVATYPLQVIQSLQRYGTEDTKKKSMVEIMSAIIKRNGVNGLYKGLETKLIQTVLTAALMYLCYEKISSFVFQIMKVKRH